MNTHLTWLSDTAFPQGQSQAISHISYRPPWILCPLPQRVCERQVGRGEGKQWRTGRLAAPHLSSQLSRSVSSIPPWGLFRALSLFPNDNSHLRFYGAPTFPMTIPIHTFMMLQHSQWQDQCASPTLSRTACSLSPTPSADIQRGSSQSNCVEVGYTREPKKGLHKPTRACAN